MCCSGEGIQTLQVSLPTTPGCKREKGYIFFLSEFLSIVGIAGGPDNFNYRVFRDSS